MEVRRRRQGFPTRVVERTNNLSARRPPTLPYTGAESKYTKDCALLHPTFPSDLRACLSDASPAADSKGGRNRPSLSVNHSWRDQSMPLKSGTCIDRLQLRSSRLPALLDSGVSQPESRVLSDGKTARGASRLS